MFAGPHKIVKADLVKADLVKADLVKIINFYFTLAGPPGAARDYFTISL